MIDLENSVFLENYIDLFCLDKDCLAITYDVSIHQPIEKFILNNTSLIIKGNKLWRHLFDTNKCYVMKEYKITNKVVISNYITYTIRIGRIEGDDSIHIERVLKIKKMLEDNKHF